MNKLKTYTIEEVYEKYVNYIYKIFYFKTYCKEDSEDLTTVTFMKVAKSLNHYDCEKAAMSTWLTKIANNVYIDFLRKRNPSKVALEEDILVLSNKDDNDYVEYRNRSILNKAIETLKDEEQNILYLRYTLEYSYEEIAHELGISVNNVGIRLNRLNKKIKDILEKKGLVKQLDLE